MAVSGSDLVALQRSAAMLTPGQKQPVDRDVLNAMCSELLESRALIARFGDDLRTIAKRSQS